MGQVKFYKDGNVWLYNEGIDTSVDKTVPPGNYRKSVINTTISIRGKESTFSLFSPDYIEVTEIQKSATPGDNYADIAEFNTATDSFFSGQSTSLTDSNGKSIDVQNPLPTDGDSVYCKDLCLINSDIGDFNGELCTLFDDYTSPNIAASVGEGGVNPKSFTLVFKRPIASSTVGIGSPDTSISNAKLILIGLSGDPVKVVDLSADDTKKSVELFQFEQKIFIGAQILFYTDDQVVIGGAGITKTQFVAIDAINGVISNDNSTETLLLANEEFVGGIIDTKNYGIVIASVFSNVPSAVNGFVIEFSKNLITWRWDDKYSITVNEINKGKTYSVQPQARWMRVRYLNGPTNQDEFELETQLKPVYIKPSSHRVGDSISAEDDAELVKSILSGQDQNNIFQNIKSTEVGNLRVADFLVEVGRGNIPGYSFNRKFGQIDSVQASTPADVWEYGITSGAEKYTFSTTDDIDTISSSDAGDAQDVIVDGLDINGDEVIQTATLDGQNKVSLTTPLWRFNRAYNDNAIDFSGNVYVYVDGAITNGVPNVVTTVRGFILAGKGQTNQSIFTVPNAKTALLFGEEISLTKAGGATVVAADFEEKMREFGKVFRNKEFFTLISSGTSSKNYNFPVPLEIIGKTDILPSVNVSANGVGASWAYTMLIIDD